MEDSTTAPIISTDRLQQLIGQPNLRVLDASTVFGRQPDDCPRLNFLKQHIQGAQFLDLDTLKDQSTDLPYMLPNQKQFIEAMKRLDCKLSDRVVVYDTHQNQFFGYRAAWMFQAFGHKNVSVLDGGFPKWIGEGKPVVQIEPEIDEKDFDFKVIPDKVKVLE